ncbi:beta-propeller fold lactonase family protein [Flavobacteriaceae bacterium S356]|uniref:Beta-propeller fold lactonase family protein n=1 Tax=Asprobacillus argus TaxID=3076534 RepID=A0ABU3LEB4_9FLAO|nr:beta-propeller fold lactonase family protein [Flavobacteriaceae bacterium S356]
MLRKSGAWHLILCLTLLLGIGVNAQSLSYSGTNSFNISSSTHLDVVNIPMLERTPTGMTFGDSGTKLYLVGTSGDAVVQFTLSTAYDVSTRGTIQSYYRVNGEETAPEDVTFNDTGTRMYVLGGSGDDVTQYTLSTAWDVSTASTPVVWDTRTAIENLLGATNGDRLTGMAFNDDGSKVFVIDRRSDDIFEFDLSTNYDISTVSAVIDNIPTTGEGNPRSISFNADGTRIYIIGNAGDDVTTYTLTTGFDLSSLTGTTVSVALTEDNTPQALLINDDGTTFYVAGSVNDQINEYTLSAAFDFSSTITHISAAGFPTVEITPHGMVFNDDGTKLFVAGDQANAIAEIALSTPYDITTARFTAGLYVNSEQTQIRGLAFNNTGTTLYIIGNQNDEIDGYDLSAAYDLTSTITTTTGSPWSIATEDTNPSDLFFNNDGTKLYVMGNTGDDINQYSLSPAYDMTDAIAANLDIAFPLNNVSGLVIDSAPLGGIFNNDGTKLYIAGNQGNDINEITLSNAYDLSSGTITSTATYSVNSEESTITDVAFNGDGSKFFIVGTNGDDMNQYQTRGNLPETSTNNGTIDVTTPLVITLTGDTFADVDADNLLDLTTEFTIANLPPGLTPIFTLTGGDTVATLTFSGTADSHIDSDEAAANMSFTFTDDAFTSSNAADVALAVAHTNVMGFDFIECPSNEIVYNGSWSGGSGAGGAPDETDDASGIRIEADVTITANFDCDCLHVDSGFTLSTATGVQAKVINALELEGDLRLLGTSQLIQEHTGTRNVSGTGNVYKDRMGTLSNVYQIGYWTSPVTTNGSTYTISGVLRDGTTALTASNTPGTITYTDDLDGNTTPVTLSRRWFASFLNSGIWTEEIGETATLNPGEGFTKKSTGAGAGQNYTFLGRPNDGDYIFTIGAFGSGRWSLMGNPYPSPIDADQFITDNAVTTTSIEGTLYFYEAGNDTSHTTSEYTGGYANRVVGMGNPASELGMSGKTPGQYIGIGQGFFIEASSSGGDVTFDNGLRVFDPTDANTVYFGRNSTQRNETPSFPILRLGFEFDLNGEIYHRRVSVGFRGLTQNHESGYEAEMWDYKSSDLALKINDRATPHTIAGIEDFDNSLEIPLMLQLDQERAVTFMVDETEQLTTDIYIKDAVTNFYYNITNSSQEITMPAGTYNDRFFITFDNTLGTDDPLLESQLLLFAKDKQLIVKSNTIEIQSLTTYSILGQEIDHYQNTTSITGEVTLPIEKYATGIYIVKVSTNKGIVSKKIVVN